jgi:hypothetical protein
VAALSPADAVRLRAEVQSELGDLSRVLGEIRIRREARDDTTTFALALLLQNYYTGAERIFPRISINLGGLPPTSARWHSELLDDMALELSGIRPTVLERGTVDGLSRLLRLRHALRNLYAWTLRRSELDAHLSDLDSVHESLVTDLTRFDAFLAALSDS